MKSILVMGGTTFVSRCLAKYLINQGYDVDILTRGLKIIDYGGFKNHLICDRKSQNELQKVLYGKQYEFIFDISAYKKEDVEILLASIDRSSLKKYIFCSSGAVYTETNDFVNESFEKGDNPNWGNYGTDKKEAEDFIINSKIPYIIFRPTYIYGENNNLYREAYFFDRIKESKVIPMPYGNNTVTQFIHIEDLVKVFESAMFNEKVGRIYNVTNPNIISFEELILTCGKVLGIDPIIKRIDTMKIKLDTRTYFPFRDVTYLLNTEKLINDDLHNPTISLEEGLRKTYKWYINNKPNLADAKMDKINEMVKC